MRRRQRPEACLGRKSRDRNCSERADNGRCLFSNKFPLKSTPPPFPGKCGMGLLATGAGNEWALLRQVAPKLDNIHQPLERRGSIEAVAGEWRCAMDCVWWRHSVGQRVHVLLWPSTAGRQTAQAHVMWRKLSYSDKIPNKLNRWCTTAEVRWGRNSHTFLCGNMFPHFSQKLDLIVCIFAQIFPVCSLRHRTNEGQAISCVAWII